MFQQFSAPPSHRQRDTDFVQHIKNSSTYWSQWNDQYTVLQAEECLYDWQALSKFQDLFTHIHPCLIKLDLKMFGKYWINALYH